MGLVGTALTGGLAAGLSALNSARSVSSSSSTSASYSGVGKEPKKDLSGNVIHGYGSSSSGSPMSGINDYYNLLTSIADRNNAWSAQQAQKQMDFQRQSDERAMQYNHDEAELNRLWQERMSNTAHQREIKDLQAAGLNPVLSVMGGSGAPVTSGATASGYTSQGAKGDTDTSVGPALMSLLGSLISAQASMANTITSASAQERIAQLGVDSDRFRALTAAASAREVANIQGTTSRDVANIQGLTSRVVAGMNNETSKIVARIGAGATVTSAQIHAAGQAAAAQISGSYNLSVAKTNQLTNILTHAMDNATSKGIASANRDLQRELQKSDFDFRMEFAEDQYTRDWKLMMWNNGADLLGSAVNSFGGLSGLLGLFG